MESGLKIIICSLLTISLVCAGLSAHAQDAPHLSAAESQREYYSMSGDRVLLGVLRITVDDWRDKREIDRQVQESGDMNYLWDDQWYFETMSDSRNDLLVLFWRNIDLGRVGWVAIKNTPNTWFYTSDRRNADWTGIENGEKVNIHWPRYYGSCNTNGPDGCLSIDIKNPENTDGYTSDDILVSFGK